MSSPISVYIINYNGADVILDTIRSLKEQDYPSLSITLLDDGSNDNGISLVQKYFPDVEIIGLGYNSGFPNILRKKAIDMAKTRYVFVTDNDIVYEKNCLSNLIKSMQDNENVGLCTPRLMYHNDRNKIYVCWTKFHYLCYSISPLRDTYTAPEPSPIDTLGGGIMLIDKEKTKITGNIDDSYPMGWGEDAEIYARMKIAGFRTLYVPDTVGYHHAKEFVTKRTARPFGQARNRWHMILSMYQIKTLLLISPALFFYELVSTVMLIPKGMNFQYTKGVLCALANIRTIWKKRKEIQQIRKIKDKDMLTTGPLSIPRAYLSNPIYRVGTSCLNWIFCFYWKVIRFFL